MAVVTTAARYGQTTSGCLAVDHYEPLVDGLLAVVIVHGVMDRASGFRRAIRHMNAEVWAIDRRGYGRSQQCEQSAEISVHAADVVRLCEEIGRPAVVVGHSQGALIALHAAAANARGENGAALIAGVVAWEPPMPWFDWYGSELGDAVRVMPPADAAETFMREVVGERLWGRVPTAVKQQRQAEGSALLADLEASRAESGRPNLSDISVPTVAAYGTSTAAHSRRTAQLVADEVAGAELVVIEGSNHGVHLSHPREFAALVNRVCEEWR